ncbi:putative conserved membrane protein [Synechococcus sp. BIOS-U3-1]|uniref:hypothetical protein n=1 Tax=Synechococcus sp. BIOS-U3-1 TaxID=1400865 RepID=UPI00164686F5|nr:hypothetical protein [Synechococcus sp. BIOS-U3-1]QNI58896.1 putative conserved membrane protein [Synechococcus sp. BIOS-U3-1]|tara:strand:+ start:867 stop:1253 length:387 start_codon:yes stop_codon:yes gene_type:complete
MKLSLPSLQELKKKLEEGLLSNKTYIATLLIFNILYILPKFTAASDPSSILIATIPPAFIISVVITFARDRYIKNTLVRRLMEDSYIPSVYKSDIDLRALDNSTPLKKERAQTRQWIEINILDRISSK